MTNAACIYVDTVDPKPIFMQKQSYLQVRRFNNTVLKCPVKSVFEHRLIACRKYFIHTLLSLQIKAYLHVEIRKYWYIHTLQ